MTHAYSAKMKTRQPKTLMQALIRHGQCVSWMNSDYGGCQSIYVCSANFARVAMVTARAGFTIVQLFLRRYFSLVSCTIHQTPETQIEILRMHRIELNLFLSLCQKSRLFETICSLQLIAKVGHFWPIFCPYLEFLAWLSLAMSASLKYIVDKESRVSKI